MTCLNYRPLISQYLDGEIAPRERLAVEVHLAVCMECRSVFNDWQQHTQTMRNLLDRHRLSPDFVQRVHRAAEAGGASPVLRMPDRRKVAVRWMKVAAAVLVSFLLLNQFSQQGPRNGVARVVDPGDGLQVRGFNSAEWSPTSAGAVIRSGDWVRNSDPGSAEIRLVNTSQLVLGQGALAQLQSGLSSSGHLRLLRGSVLSHIEDGVRTFTIKTAAGNVSGPAARFGVRVGSISLPSLETFDDNRELLVGSVLPLGGVIVDHGKIRVETAGGTREVSAGDVAYFAGGKLYSISNSGEYGVRASLKSDPQGMGEKGALRSALLEDKMGPLVQVEAKGLSLRRLLQSTTGDLVVGGDDVRLSGSISYPVDSSQDEVIAAIGRSLGVPISVRQTQVHQRVAYLSDAVPASSAGYAPKGTFEIRRSSEGLLSFKFVGVSASQVFQSLRSERVDLPEISAASEWVPITLEASGLSPQQVAPLLEKKLGMTVQEANQMVRVVEIGGTSSPANTPDLASDRSFQSAASAVKVDSRRASGGRPAELAPDKTALTAPSSSMPAADSNLLSGRPLWSILATSGGGAVTLPRPATPLGIPQNSGQKDVTTKDSAPGSMRPRSSNSGAHQFVWPLISGDPSLDGSASYLLYNGSTIRVRTLWNGYLADGRLVAQREQLIEPFSTIAVHPGDLPELEAGAHWETLSDTLLVSSDDLGPGFSVFGGTAVDAPSLPTRLEMPVPAIQSLTNLWFVNPSESPSRLVLAVVSNDHAVTSQQFLLPPHAGMTWILDDLLSNHPEIKDLLANSRLLLQVMEGAVTTGSASLFARNKLPGNLKAGQPVH